MAKICSIPGKRPLFGNKISHANNKSRRRWEPNLQWKAHLGAVTESVRTYACQRPAALRTMQKLGIDRVLGRI